MPTKKDSRRFDFVIENPQIDKKTGKFSFTIVPHPDRYELKDIKEQKYYYDKFDNVYIKADMLMSKMTNEIIGHPIYYSPPKIHDIDSLFKSRMAETESYLDGKEQEYSFVDKSEDFLSKLQEKEQLRYVILSVDLMGSTKMSQELGEQDNAKIVSLFLREMTVMANNFNGLVLKFLGDGIIVYFHEPDFIGKNDNAINCALVMKQFIGLCLNPILKKRSMPELRFRIGIDSGEATKIIVGHQELKQHTDLIGQTINIATKIQGLAKENEILLGESTILNVHTNWRKDVILINTENWDYVDQKTGKFYKVYKLNR